MDVEPIQQDDPPAYRWWQVIVLIAAVALCDITIYRGEGFAGYALLFTAAPVLFCLLRFRPQSFSRLVLLGLLLGLLAARLAWWGSDWHLAIGFALLAAFAMSLSARRPFPVETVVFAAKTIPDGYLAIARQWRTAKETSPHVTRPNLLAVALPAGALLAFGLLFVLANPDLSAFLGKRVEYYSLRLREWIENFAPSIWEILFWLAAFWILAGALRPAEDNAVTAEILRDETRAADEPSDWYRPYRNTLWAVILLFAVYLVFEFQTLWFREFPPGFHYSGYAHEGAFWLTVALALTTLILSLVFRGCILRDERRAKLRTLAWLWSAENLLLAAAVYHRLLIYIGFNGMTRMRVVGFCGISAVVVGFLLVLVKIAAERDFVWLIRRQLWVLFFFVYLYAVSPVDDLVMRYNTARILEGDPAPSVQISVHPIDPDGLIQIIPLLDSEDDIIREGVRALLAEHYAAAKRRERQWEKKNWTATQFADRALIERLDAIEARLKFRNYVSRQRALRRFHAYAYQWY